MPTDRARILNTLRIECYLCASIRPPRVRGSLSKVRQSFNFGRFRFVSESTNSQKQHMNRKLEEKSFSGCSLIFYFQKSKFVAIIRSHLERELFIMTGASPRDARLFFESVIFGRSKTKSSHLRKRNLALLGRDHRP